MKSIEAAKLLRVSHGRLLQHCRAGEFGAKKIKGEWVLLKMPIHEATINCKAIAEALNVTTRRIQLLCKQERIQAIRIGKQWRIGFSCATKLMLARLSGFSRQ